MPYSKENKEKAKAYVAAVRSRTNCEKCGNQPIDWHHEDHLSNENQRVAHLASLGFPIDRIQQEIDKCEALCRSCHMEEDGRLVELRKNCPNKKGDKHPPKACDKCGKLSNPQWKKMCRSCYDHKRRGT